MNELAAAVLAAGELICEFQAGYKRSLIADLVEPPRAEFLLIYESVQPTQAQVVSTRKPGRKPVRVPPSVTTSLRPTFPLITRARTGPPSRTSFRTHSAAGMSGWPRLSASRHVSPTRISGNGSAGFSAE